MAQTRLVVRGGQVVLPDRGLVRVDVALEGGLITELAPMLGPTGRTVEAGDCLVIPGLVDLHVHGIGALSLEESSLADYARLEAAAGCTTFFPTLFGPPGRSIELLQRHRRESDELKALPQVGGFRLESPYLAGTGAGLSEDLAPISDDLTDALLKAGGGHIRIWDVSPELTGAPVTIARLRQQGILCSLAHTAASIEQARLAVDAGARLVTHLYDTFVLPAITDPDPGVYPAGLTDYLLIEDRVACEIIGDGTHVHPLLVEIALRCKGTGRLAFVTDGNFGAGLPPGRYPTPKWGDVLVDGPNAGVRLPDREMELAGSALRPIDSFRNAMRLFAMDAVAACQVCCRTPSRLLGLNKGEIAPGRDADLVVLGPDLEVRCTIARGEVVYQMSESG